MVARSGEGGRTELVSCLLSRRIAGQRKTKFARGCRIGRSGIRAGGPKRLVAVTKMRQQYFEFGLLDLAQKRNFGWI
jgi:hypothetical protein